MGFLGNFGWLADKAVGMVGVDTGGALQAAAQAADNAVYDAVVGTPPAYTPPANKPEKYRPPVIDTSPAINVEDKITEVRANGTITPEEFATIAKALNNTNVQRAFNGEGAAKGLEKPAKEKFIQAVAEFVEMAQKDGLDTAAIQETIKGKFGDEAFQMLQKLQKERAAAQPTPQPEPQPQPIQPRVNPEAAAIGQFKQAIVEANAQNNQAKEHGANAKVVESINKYNDAMAQYVEAREAAGDKLSDIKADIAKMNVEQKQQGGLDRAKVDGTRIMANLKDTRNIAGFDHLADTLKGETEKIQAQTKRAQEIAAASATPGQPFKPEAAVMYVKDGEKKIPVKFDSASQAVRYAEGDKKLVEKDKMVIAETTVASVAGLTETTVTTKQQFRVEEAGHVKIPATVGGAAPKTGPSPAL